MELSNILQKLNIKTRKKDLTNININNITLNSKYIKKNSLFISLTGKKFKSNNFIKDAINKGSIAVITDSKYKTNIGKVPVIYDNNIKKKLSSLLSFFYNKIQKNIIAITGTNGKTSVSWYVFQFLSINNINSSYLGTLGQFLNGKKVSDLENTTPDICSIYNFSQEHYYNGSNTLIFEASSHGIKQKRFKGLPINVAVLTNISREHLDYHKNMDSYKQVKFSLFTNHVLNGGKAIINSNIVLPNRVIKKIKKKFISFVSFGKKNSDIYISKKRKNYEIKLFKEKYTILMNTKTSYEIRNIECAIAILLTIGIKKNKIINTINKLNNPPGRMESCLAMKNGSRVYVDFAHTPDALKNILISVRKSNGRKPNLIFGCGGNRDKSKRFKMGKIASLLANKIYVTDDNPRNETPSAIRKSIMRGCINAEDIGDRRQAIFKGIKDLRNKEILIIAGKGHEKFQIYNEKNLPFDDVKEANSIIRKINAKS